MFLIQTRVVLPTNTSNMSLHSEQTLHISHRPPLYALTSGGVEYGCAQLHTGQTNIRPCGVTTSDIDSHPKQSMEVS
jgi:hypothetical protein